MFPCITSIVASVANHGMPTQSLRVR